MTLSDVRVGIDRVDKQIKALLQERMELADQVAQVKAETGDDILKPDREAAMIARLTEDVRPEIRKEYAAVLKRIIEASRKYQYGRMLELRDCLDIQWETEEKHPEKVAMAKRDLYICSMMSKDQVILAENNTQLGEWLQEDCVDAGIGILGNVGMSAEDEVHCMLVDKGLFINRCQVVSDNGILKKVCMFGKKLIVRPEHNRIRIMFVCPNRSGALATILTMIADYKVNITEIHSRPNQKKEWNYEFYVEIAGNLLEKEMQALVYQLSKETEYFQLLGSYGCKGDFPDHPEEK